MSDQDQKTTDIVHGAGKTTDEVPIARASNTAPLPEGLSEVNDRELSIGAAPGHHDGSGGSHVRTNEEDKGLGSLPGDKEQRQALGRGDADIKDR